MQPNLARSEASLAQNGEANFLDRLSADTFRTHVANVATLLSRSATDASGRPRGIPLAEDDIRRALEILDLFRGQPLAEVRRALDDAWIVALGISDLTTKRIVLDPLTDGAPSAGLPRSDRQPAPAPVPTSGDGSC